MFWIAGIGASAGGLEASKELLAGLPLTGRLACVIANHQAVDGHTEILVRQLALAAPEWEVRVARDGEAMQAGRVYVLPAGRDGEVVGGRLVLRDPLAGSLSTPSVNVLLCSLAESCGSHGIGVILSGTGSDGVAGCRVLRSRGGLTFAQSDPRFDGMPKAAQAAAAIDHCLPARQIAAHLAKVGAPSPPSSEPGICDLVELVLRHTGLDFSGYKPETLIRRAQARMTRLGLRSLSEYLSYARRNPQEVGTLQAHFLVSLSSFFRDPECFQALRQTLQTTLENKTAFSIWSPGCATGEEAYSLAMLTHELAASRQVAVQVVGSDLNTEALATAERGVYQQSALACLPPPMVASYFQKTGPEIRVREALSAMCTFRRQDVIHCEAPPSPHLISCRNLLIYLKADLQTQLLRKFHRALAPEGLLFLGPAETLGPQGNLLFSPVDAQHRIFRRRHVAG